MTVNLSLTVRSFKSTARGEITMKEIALAVDLNCWVFADWKKKYEKYGESAFEKPTKKEQEELKQLKKELETVKMERDILKKAMAIFSKDGETVTGLCKN
jgi:transposase-like protein